MTLRVNVQDTDVHALCQSYRREKVALIGSNMQNFLRNKIGYLCSYHPKDDKQGTEPSAFIFTVVRDAGFAGDNIKVLLDKNKKEFYSLDAGLEFLGSGITEEALNNFLNSDLSIRKDTFFSLKRNALLIESQSKRQNFTRQRLPANASQEAIENREEYNDLNYLIWLEILLYQRHLLHISYQSLQEFDEAPIDKRSVYEIMSFHDKMSTLINNLQGSMTTVYETYQEWLAHGRKVMGIDALYQIFQYRIGQINTSIQSKYQYEQISRQNWLSEISVWLSKVVLFFCILQFIESLLKMVQENKALQGIADYRLEIYMVFSLIFIGYFVLSLMKLRRRGKNDSLGSSQN